MKAEERELINKTQVEKDFFKQLDLFYCDDGGDDIERVIEACDRRLDCNFGRAWCDLEDQEIILMFIDLFKLDVRSMLEELVIQRFEEDKERAQEAIDRINDLRGLHG